MTSTHELFDSESASKWIEEFLNIKNCVDIIKQSPTQFLDLYLASLQEHCPFTNLWDTLMEKEFGPPPLKDPTNPFVKLIGDRMKYVLAGYGGTCITLAALTCSLLNALGYQSQLSLTITHNKPGMEMMHAIVIVTNVSSNGDAFMLDPGSRISPIFQAVPLREVDKHGNLFLGRSAFCDNKVVKVGDLYQRYFRTYDSSYELPSDWQMFYDFDGKPLEIYNEIERTIDYTPYFRLSRYTFELNHLKKINKFWSSSFTLVGFPRGIAVRFLNKKLFIYERNGIKKIEFKNRNDQIQALTFYFPQLPHGKILQFFHSFWPINESKL